ncbi:DUF5004 domain-containing protein [Arachidicoccus terrestris]|uniref:DUF5004 domain-containing protein n=1 Tax=Arachidicoccus terrestris TaxID=2875539 RepID=UPI001CC587B9|nr:DUF5004 domain-containing protein [Arachidicoccus terrestris]UAY55282.1 DUF5004 domain-containing protein [Arachidicoccus terrestris]
MKNFKSFLLILTASCSLLACQREVGLKPVESTKTLNGTWKITKALRNGTDLTGRFDFSGFKIVFQDGHYSLDSLVPFPVTTDGSFQLDDPQYPFRIYFTEEGKEVRKLDMEFPVNQGVRNMIISFSPGCTSNTYQYTLQKVQ